MINYNLHWIKNLIKLKKLLKLLKFISQISLFLNKNNDFLRINKN